MTEFTKSVDAEADDGDEALTPTVADSRASDSLYTTRRGAESTEKLLRLRRSPKRLGLENPGLYCYMNSVLQMMFAATKFRYDVLHCATPGVHGVLRHLQEVFGFMEYSTRSSYDPKNFRSFVLTASSSKFKDLQQQDCEEFLNHLLNDLGKQGDAYQNLTISWRHFGGFQRRLTMKCSACDTQISVKSKQFLSIPVCVPTDDLFYGSQSQCHTVAQLVKRAVGNAHIEGCKRQCNYCSCNCDAMQSAPVCDAPQYLIVHLIRFHCDKSTGTCTKTLTPVRCDERLSLSVVPPAAEEPSAHRHSGEGGNKVDYVDRSTTGRSCKAQPFIVEYQLMAVVSHIGQDISSGHYVCYARHEISLSGESANEAEEQQLLGQHEWLLFDDNKVHQSTFDAIPGNELPLSSKTTDAATSYVVLYERIFSKAVPQLADVDRHDASAVSTTAASSAAADVTASGSRLMTAGRVPSWLETLVSQDNISYDQKYAKKLVEHREQRESSSGQLMKNSSEFQPNSKQTPKHADAEDTEAQKADCSAETESIDVQEVPPEQSLNRSPENMMQNLSKVTQTLTHADEDKINVQADSPIINFDTNVLIDQPDILLHDTHHGDSSIVTVSSQVTKELEMKKENMPVFFSISSMKMNGKLIISASSENPNNDIVKLIVKESEGDLTDLKRSDSQRSHDIIFPSSGIPFEEIDRKNNSDFVGLICKIKLRS